MIKIIINADDLGKSHEVNMAISEALQHHYITSSTIMANTTTWDDVHNIVENNPQASFGVHLNLTEGKAITVSPVLLKYNVVDSDNYFTKKVKDLKHYPEDLLNAIFEELDAQVDKVKNVEHINISHFDGHHHIHTFYPFIDVLLRLINKYDIKAIRNRYYTTYPYFRTLVNNIISSFSFCIPVSKNNYCNRKKNTILQYLYNIAENNKWKSRVGKYVILTNIFNAYETQYERCNIGTYLPSDTIIELMCHPGHPKYMKEYVLIKGNKISQVLPNCEFINYNDLSK